MYVSICTSPIITVLVGRWYQEIPVASLEASRAKLVSISLSERTWLQK